MQVDRQEGEARKAGEAQVVPLRLLTALKWLLTSIGISGLFLATGFLVDTAYQARLGYDAGTSGEILHLSVEAGRFFVDLLLISFTAVADHLVITGTVIVLAALALTGPGRRIGSKLRSRLSPRIPKPLLPWLLPALLLLEIGLLDLPVMSLHGMLIHGLQPPDDLRRRVVLGMLAKQAWLDEVCSRADENYRESLQKLLIRCPLPRNAYRQRLKDRFALNLFLTVALASWAYGRVQRQRGQGAAARRGASALVLLATLDLLLLPYSYGKSMRSTWVGEVVLSHKPQEESVHGYLLQRSSDALVVFEKNELHIWVIPAKDVGLMRIESEKDVVTFFINKRLEAAPESDASSSFP